MNDEREKKMVSFGTLIESGEEQWKKTYGLIKDRCEGFSLDSAEQVIFT